MSYRSESIAIAIERMNRQYFLPAIQREFVWKPEQIVQLFDSIMRGYPISSFLFWELKPENRDKWQVYEFLEKAHHGGTHNQLVNTDGVSVHGRSACAQCGALLVQDRKDFGFRRALVF